MKRLFSPSGVALIKLGLPLTERVNNKYILLVIQVELRCDMWFGDQHCHESLCLRLATETTDTTTVVLRDTE